MEALELSRIGIVNLEICFCRSVIRDSRAKSILQSSSRPKDWVNFFVISREWKFAWDEVLSQHYHMHEVDYLDHVNLIVHRSIVCSVVGLYRSDLILSDMNTLVYARKAEVERN